MANEQKTTPPAKSQPAKSQLPAAQAGAGSTYTMFASEDAEDNKHFKFSMVGAAIFHLILLLIHFPTIAFEKKVEKKEKKVYVVQQVRFQPPPPKEKRELPKQKTKKVPIPDPDPDEPEPIVEDVIDEPELDLPPTDDLVFDIPDAPPAAEPEGPIHVGGDVNAPVKVNAPNPQYTEIARKARIQGVVIVQAIINKQGRVENVKVLKGLPMGLEEEAVKAIKGWTFEPATLNGKPVDVYYNLTVNFRLQ